MDTQLCTSYDVTEQFIRYHLYPGRDTPLIYSSSSFFHSAQIMMDLDSMQEFLVGFKLRQYPLHFLFTSNKAPFPHPCLKLFPCYNELHHLYSYLRMSSSSWLIGRGWEIVVRHDGTRGQWPYRSAHNLYDCSVTQPMYRPFDIPENSQNLDQINFLH